MIPLDECITRGIYRLNSRNLSVGVFDGERGFIGIREKFGERFLETEYANTVRVVERIGQLPEEIELKEFLQTIDETTYRPVAFRERLGFDQEFWGWYWLDTGKPDPERKIKAVAVRNQLLFDYLNDLEES